MPTDGSDRAVDLSTASKQLAFVIHGAKELDSDFYVMIIASELDIQFGIHAGQVGEWTRIIVTSLDSPHDIVETEHANALESHFYLVKARSVVVLLTAVPAK